MLHERARVVSRQQVEIAHSDIVVSDGGLGQPADLPIVICGESRSSAVA